MKNSRYQALRRIYRQLPLPEQIKRWLGRVVGTIKNLFTLLIRFLSSKQISRKTLRHYADQILAIPGSSSEYVDLAEDHYVRSPEDPLILAYYLPQFHPTPENDEWWGPGTTEWNNVSRAVPQYLGHYQPRLPGELGYYDLRLVENLIRQVELAKSHGIYGFAYYYYWFDGKRLLDKPLDMLINNPQINFPFCLCWANESWTRRFDGTSGQILINQNETKESYQKFIESIEPYVEDNRYIRIHDRPLLIVYRPSFIPDCKDVVNYWRAYCLKMEWGDPYLIAIKENTFDGDLLSLGFDAQSEFHPGTVFRYCKNITAKIPFVQKNFRGIVLDYADLVEQQRFLSFQAEKLYRAVMPMWDNTPRRNNAGMIFHGATPELYKRWLMDVIRETQCRKDLDAPYIFVNAWNEWGESTYLEPDRRYGYAYLRATREALEATRKVSPR